MRFASPVILLSAATVAYARVIAQDGSGIPGVLTSIQTDVDGLDSALKAWTTDPKPVLDASNKLIGAIKDGTNTVQASPGLSLGDSIGLIQPASDLKSHVTTAITDLEGKKDLIVKAGLCDVVRSQLADFVTGSQGLADAVVSKVFPLGQGIAKQIADGIVSAVKGAQGQFSEDNCKSA